MRRQDAAALAILVLLGATALHAEMLWDNFISNPDQGGFDDLGWFTSEVDDAVYDSWAADDAVFESSVTVRCMEWSGLRLATDSQGQPLEYTAEVTILDTNLQELYTYAIDEYVILGIFPSSFDPFQAYQAYVALPDTPLDAGHYYFGVRLISVEDEHGLRQGQNKFLTTGMVEDGPNVTRGLTGGAVKTAQYGVPDWTLFDEAFHMDARDFAYRLYDEVLPEPASLLMLGAGLFLMRRR
jgi:hypothetical protein